MMGPGMGGMGGMGMPPPGGMMPLRPPGAPGARLFVSNLSYNTTWQQLKDHFKTLGNVTYCTVFKVGGWGAAGVCAGAGVCVEMCGCVMLTHSSWSGGWWYWFECEFECAQEG